MVVQLKRFSAFLSTYNFCSGSKIPYVLIKSSVFSCVLNVYLSTFVLFVMLALMYDSPPFLHSVLAALRP